MLIDTKILKMGFLDFIPLIGSALGAFGSIGGSSLGNNQAMKAIDKQNEANMKLAEYQFDRNVEMWNMQNAYNTPAQQMARYKEAGLNPHLIYSQGSSGNASSAPQYEAPQMQAYTNFGDYGLGDAGTHLANGLNYMADYKLKTAQEANVRQNTENLATQNELDKLKIIYQAYENSKNEAESVFWRDKLAKQLQFMDSQTRLNDITSGRTEVLKQREEQMTPLYVDHLKKKIELLLKQKGIADAQIQQIMSSAKLNQALAGVAGAQIKYYNALTNKTNTETDFFKENKFNTSLNNYYNTAIKRAEYLLLDELLETGWDRKGSWQNNVGNAIINIFEKAGDELHDLYNVFFGD